jgi:Protein of unknown function (DUF1631)
MAGQQDWTATRSGPHGHATLLTTLAGVTCQALSPMLESMFGACERLFVELANSAATTFDEQRLLDFRRELTLKKAAVMREFAARITAEFSHLQHAEAAAARTGADALALVSQEQIEKQLLVAGGVARVRSEWRTALSQLHERMRAIAPLEFGVRDNPLDPGRIAQAFLDACQQIDTDMKCLKLLCNQFDVHVLGHLDDFYRDSNQVLIDARVLPQLAAAPATPVPPRPAAPQSGERRDRDHRPWAQEGARGGGTACDGAAGIGVGSIGGLGADPGTGFVEISGLLHRLRGNATPFVLASGLPVARAGGATYCGAPAEGGDAPYGAGSSASDTALLCRSQLVAMISEAQREAGRLDPGGTRPADIRTAMGRIAARRENLSLGPAEGDVLDIVTLIFDTIAEDRNLPLEIQVLISRLQLPVLKTALLDRGFFADRGHPARQLINTIARAGSGWDSQSKETRDALLLQISRLVEALTADPGAGTEAFRTALETLKECIERTELRAVKLERRTSEKAVAEARLAAARDAVHAVMKEKLEGSELPVPVLEFFATDWQRVLQLFYLRKGTQSDEWNDAVRMLGDLVESVATPVDAVARGALARSLPELYQRLENALAQTQSHTEEAKARVDVIREVHSKLLVPEAPSNTARVVPIERARIQPPPMVPPRNPSPAAERAEPVAEPPPGVLMFESLRRADEIPVGAWFEYRDRKSGTVRRCKLSARIEETRMLLFCDRMGLLMCEKPRKVFAYELQTGEWRMIEDSPLIERTMERIAGNLRQQAGAA